MTGLTAGVSEGAAVGVTRTARVNGAVSVGAGVTMTNGVRVSVGASVGSTCLVGTTGADIAGAVEGARGVGLGNIVGVFVAFANTAGVCAVTCSGCAVAQGIGEPKVGFRDWASCVVSWPKLHDATAMATTIPLCFPMRDLPAVLRRA